ncbi:MAG TPA: polysaccharide lyase family protein [Verrucomicrobiae bacterium]
MKHTLAWSLICFACSLGAQSAISATVFQIGVSDHDYHEFSLAGHYREFSKEFPNDVDFSVGQSDAKKDWPYVLPGPQDAWAGSKVHEFKIHFQVTEPLSGYYELIMDFVSTHPRGQPKLVMDINGEKITATLPPGDSENALTNPKAGKNSTTRQLFPATLLHPGDNTITLSDIEGSWAIFDDVRLESGAPAPEKPLGIAVEPLPFFKRSGDNRLLRAVRVSITNLENDSVPVELDWNANGVTGSSQTFNLPFGGTELPLLVPDVAQIDFTVRLGGHEIKLPVSLPPAKKWKVYIVPTSHTDIGYTDLQDRVQARHAQNGLDALDLLDADPIFKWNSETFWQLNCLLELHPEKTGAVFAALRQKRWGLSADYANMLTGLCSSETLDRLTLDSRNLANRGGFELNSAILDDVPSVISSVPMVLANSGIKYFIEGANRDRGPYAGNVPNPFYWEGADGSRVLADITTVPGYGGAGKLLITVPRAMKELPPFLARFETPDYPYDAVLVNGAFGDNREIQPWLPKVVKEWNAEWDYPQLILALPADFFGYMEKNYSNKIPVLKTDFGGWWEDGAGSSALETMLSRRAEERDVTSEMLHSLASMVVGDAYPKTNFDNVWHDALLYNEHTWGAAGSVSAPNSEQTVKQWEVKSSFAREADSESRKLLASGMAKLADIAPAADLVVFNSLAWTRKAVVKTDATGALQDMATKKTFPCQALPEGGNCFIADRLPSIGYRCYQNATLSTPAPDAAEISSNQIENEFYRVTLNPKTGGIQSIYDKELKSELVDTNADFGLGELVYVTGGEGTSAIHSDLNRLPPPKFEYHWQGGTGIKALNGPVFGELDSEATNLNFPKITMRVRLYRDLKQLDLIFELDKTETMDKEAVYLAFPFAPNPRQGGLWLEYPDEITEPLKDQHPSACRDWYSVQRWLAISDGNATVELSPLDAPLFTLGDMTASTWPRKITPKRGHVFGYIMNNYWHTNYKAKQGGRLVFQYSLTSSKGSFSKKDAVVKGWNMYCPAVAARGQGGHKAISSSAAMSLVSVSPAGLPLTTIKEAEDLDGFIFRYCDFAGIGGTAKLTLPKPAIEVLRCNLVETDPLKLTTRGKTITVPVKPFAPTTIKTRFAPQ